MADQKRWFKVWTSILSDDDFDPSSRPGGLIGLGRMAMLGAYTALHGESGVVEIMPNTLFRLTQAQTLDELRADLALKNLSFEEGKNRYGKVTVTWAKWRDYQEDSTARERMQRLRSKRRGEERRGEETRREEKRDPDSPSADPKKRKPMSEELKTVGERIWNTDKKKYDRLWEWIGKKRKEWFADAVLAEVLRRFEPYAGDNSIQWWGYLETICAKEQKNMNGRRAEIEGQRRKAEEREWLENKNQ